MVLDLVTITGDSLVLLWKGFLSILPKIIGALIVFLVGWLVAVIIGKIVEEILKRIRFNQIFERDSFREALEKAELKVDASAFVGAITKWVLVIVFLTAAVEVLGLIEFSRFLGKILAYIPNVIVAVLIFVVAVVIADIAEKVARALVESMRIGYGKLAGTIVRWSIWIFAILAILRQLLIVPGMVDTLFRGLVYGFIALFVIAGGIAFGLGGKDVASDILQELRRRLKK